MQMKSVKNGYITNQTMHQIYAQFFFITVGSSLQLLQLYRWEQNSISRMWSFVKVNIKTTIAPKCEPYMKDRSAFHLQYSSKCYMRIALRNSNSTEKLCTYNLQLSFLEYKNYSE